MVVRTTKQRTAVAWIKRRGAEALGLLLLLVGVAALFLPGPGLLTIAAGLAVLSTQYAWAERLLHPLKARAFRLAAEGVRSWPRVVCAALGALVMVAIGITALAGIAMRRRAQNSALATGAHCAPAGAGAVDISLVPAPDRS